jgi:uncharacterized iron-regulated membrane protein
MSRAKPQLLKIHRYVGLGLALLLAVQGITGALLVFRDEIERIIHPALIVEPLSARVPVQAMMDTVERAHPDIPVNRAEFPAWDDSAVLFKLVAKDGSRWLTAVDPYRNIIVRDAPMSVWPGEWIFYIHYGLLAGPTGHIIVGIEGLTLLILALTGPIVWWPGRKRLKQGFRIETGRGADLKWRTLHRAGGAIIAPVLLVSAFTGAAMVWKDEFRDLLRIATPVADKPSPKVAEQPGVSMVPLDRLIAVAKKDYGPTDVRQIRFSDGGRVAAVFLDSDLTVRPDGAKQIYYDRYAGADIGHYVAGTLPTGSEIVDWLFPVHSGLFGGVVTRFLAVVAGLSLMALSLSGPWLWYSRTARKRSRAPSRPMAAMTEGR